MIISSIVAVSNNNVIGVNNDLPWHMPSDLKYFKKMTHGHYILMGRKSFESIGRPLPGRTNIVVTRNKSFYHSGVHTEYSISDGINAARAAGQKELFIVGGANIYAQTLNLIDHLYITRVNTVITNGSAFFPDFDLTSWETVTKESHHADADNPFDFSFCHYRKS